MDAPATALQLYACERYLKNSNHAPYCACICSHYRFRAHIDANWNVEWQWMKIIETNVSLCVGVCLCAVSFNHSHSLATISIIFLLVKFEVCVRWSGTWMIRWKRMHVWRKQTSFSPFAVEYHKCKWVALFKVAQNVHKLLTMPLTILLLLGTMSYILC